MKSVWHEMGMREDQFKGVIPEKFLEKCFAFFSSLRNQCRKDLDPYYTPPSWERYMNFYGKDKFLGTRTYSSDAYNDYWSYFTYFSSSPRNGNKVPVGSPVPEELWQSDQPRWEKTDFSEKELLQEEISPHPLNNNRSGGGFAASLNWHRQRYRLIQKMRYCIVPLQISYQEYYSRNWYNMSGGFVDSSSFSWDHIYKLRMQFPEYWCLAGTSLKIGVYAEKVYGTRLPLSGSFMHRGSSFTTDPPPVGKSWQGSSLLRVYGMADLSTHPDFSHYFEINTEKEEF
jgi:hypothetical protein